MIKGQIETIIYKKSAKIAHEVIKKLWQNRQEFSPMLEQIVLETLRENLTLIYGSHAQRTDVVDMGLEFFRSYSSTHSSTIIALKLTNPDQEGLNVLEEFDEDARVLKWTKFVIAVK